MIAHIVVLVIAVAAFTLGWIRVREPFDGWWVLSVIAGIVAVLTAAPVLGPFVEQWMYA